MRHRRAVALTVVALAGLAGCNGPDPNNLETYYDDPVPVPSTPSALAAVPRAASAAGAPENQAKAPAPSVVAQAPDLMLKVDAALLSDEDVASEGVHPGTGQAAGCLTGSVSATSRSSTWLYLSGSVLRHKVAAYPDRSGAEVVSSAECVGTPLTVATAKGVDRQQAWCDGTTCTVMLAKGNLVSALSITASSEARAADAAKRLLPIVAAKLTALTAQP